MAQEIFKIGEQLRKSELCARKDSLWALDGPQSREIAETAKLLYERGEKIKAFSFAAAIKAEANATEVLAGLCEYAFWNWENHDTDMSRHKVPHYKCTPALCEFYFCMLEGAAKELHKRRTKGDKKLKDDNWTFENRYVMAALSSSRPEDALDMVMDIPTTSLSQRTATLLVTHLFKSIFIEEEDSKDALDKAEKRLDNTKIINIVYTMYSNAKQAVDKKQPVSEQQKSTVAITATLLSFWYQSHDDYEEAKRFLADAAQPYAEGMKSHLDSGIESADLQLRMTHATLGAAVFTGTCVGLYSYSVHAATNVPGDMGANLWALHTLPAVIAAIILKLEWNESDSVFKGDRPWAVGRFAWVFLFFALALVPVWVAYIVAGFFFFFTLWAYPRYRGWL